MDFYKRKSTELAEYGDSGSMLSMNNGLVEDADGAGAGAGAGASRRPSAFVLAGLVGPDPGDESSRQPNDLQDDSPELLRLCDGIGDIVQRSRRTQGKCRWLNAAL